MKLDWESEKVIDMGRKPSVAFVNQSLAIENIEKKRDVLKAAIDWCLEQSVEPADVDRVKIVKSALPKSVRQFNKWKAEGLPIEISNCKSIYSINANATLAKQPKLIADVRFLLDRLRQIKSIRSTEERLGELFAAITRRASHSEALRLIAERELIALKRSNAELRSQVQALANELRALKREAAATIHKLREQLPTEKNGLAPRRITKSNLELVN